MANKNSAEGLFKRLSRLFKDGPVIKRKIRSVDTTIAVPDKTKSSGTLLFQKSLSPTYATITANAYNLSERLMRYQDFQEMEYSLSFQTLIPTTEGLKQLGELALECSKDPNKTFIVYSYDHEKKQIVPALGKQARQTCIDHAWRITFDNGKSITASPEHRLMLRDGTYRKVEDLQLGDAMMPFYRKDLFENAKEGTKGYKWIYTMDTRFRGWTKEHQLIAEWIAGRKLTYGEVVHHINFDKSDNRPENLRIMSEADHNSLHATINNEKKWSLENEQWIKKFKKNHAAWMRDNAPTKRKDVTFARIVQVAERVGFNLSAISSALDVSLNLIHSRLVSNGFSTFSSFLEAYSAGQQDALIGDRPGLLTRDLSIKSIRSVISERDTKRSLSVKLGCTVNVLDKFLRRRLNTTWNEFRTSIGFKPNNNVGGRPCGKNNVNITYKQICDAMEPCLTLPRLAERLNVNKNTVLSRLAQHGHVRYSEFRDSYENCKVASIEYVGEIPLYDLTVDGYKNFATDSVISHNTPEIASALDIYSDESVAQDDKGRVLHVFSENEKIKEVLEDLFYNVLNVEFNLRSWVRNLVKYGDFFLYNDVSPEYGVINAFPVPVNEIEREENYDHDHPFSFRFRWVSLGNRILENWEISHFRLLGNDMFLPYGSSVIEPARRIWRQMILIEDAMLVYRVVRAPERRVFYIDVANIPADDVPKYMQEQKRELRSSQVVDSTTSRVDLRYNPLSVDEDYFIPVRGGETGTKIDTLQAGQNTGTVEDVAYIQKKLFAALKIPKAYLGYDDMLSSKATLAQEDIRFSRSINVIQKTVIAELNKLAIIHLFARGYQDDDLINFTLRLSNPSTVAQQQKLELWRAKFEIAGSSPEGMMSKPFIYRNIMDLTDEEIDEINKERLRDKIIDAMIESGPGGEEGGPGGGGAGGGDLFGGGGIGGEGGGDEDIFAGEEGGAEESEEETPPEENAGVEPEEDEEPELDLLTSSDDQSDPEQFELPSIDGDKPVKVSPQLKHVLYNRSRRRTHGASKTHLPDFMKMTSNDDREDTLRDPYDMNYLKSILTNPMSESPEGNVSSSPRLGTDIVEMLQGMSQKFCVSQKDDDTLVLLEGEDVQDEIDAGTLIFEANDVIVDDDVDDKLEQIELDDTD